MSKYNLETDILELAGKVILVTGGELLLISMFWISAAHKLGFHPSHPKRKYNILALQRLSRPRQTNHHHLAPH